MSDATTDLQGPAWHDADAAPRYPSWPGPINSPAWEDRFDKMRIRGQRRRVFDLLYQRRWYTLHEAAQALPDDSEAGISARIRDFRKARYGGFDVQRRRRREGGGTWEYRILPPLGGQMEIPG